MIDACLILLLLAACVSDLRTRRIPNWLVVVIAVAGAVLIAATKGFGPGLIQVGAGFGTGFLIWIPFYALGMVGAGDVKLFAAASSFVGAHAAVEASLYTALFGGVLSFVYMVTRSGVGATLIRVGHAVHQPELLRNDPTVQRRRMPYALAITLGFLTAVCWPGHIVT